MTVEQRDVLVLLPTREQLRLAVGVSAGDRVAVGVSAGGHAGGRVAVGVSAAGRGAERGESGWAEHGRGPWGPCGACELAALPSDRRCHVRTPRATSTRLNPSRSTAMAGLSPRVRHPLG